MKTYLVGGAVRDKLLGIAVYDRDWVVVGSTPEAMTDAGFLPVGKDFPVFIKPDTGEEYALARTERKTARGYQGFSFNTSADITLEDDLIRRDLTINAMAIDDEGQLIDPHNGQADLKAGVLRHVSDAFKEDPVRVLRIARFAAKFNFQVANETLDLMKTMVSNGEVNALVAERVWGELDKTLITQHPERFLQVLRECGALKVILPELDALYGVPQTEKYHPEIDTGIHTEMVLSQAAKLTQDKLTRFAALVHDLGKAATPENEWPSHKGHELAGVEIIKDFCNRLRVPNKYRELGCVVSEYHLHMHRFSDLKPSTMLKLFERTGSIKSLERAEQFTRACEADSRGRLGLEDRDYPQYALFFHFLKAASSVDSSAIASTFNNGEQIKQAIHQARVTAIKAARAELP